MAVKYTYSIASDTANAKVATDSLEVEIAASSIVPVVSHTHTVGDVLNIWFVSALSGAEQTTLTAVVLAHEGDPLYSVVTDNNFYGTVAPTVNDDAGSGYVVGSRWVDTVSGKEYVCVDATVAAAVWNETTGGGATTSSIVTGTSIEQTTSGTFVLVTGMTLTPAAGTYLVTASCVMLNSASNGVTLIVLAKAGTTIDHTVRYHKGTSKTNGQTQDRITVNGSEAIALYFAHSGSNTAEVRERSMILLKLA